jgi:maltose alpha-D-glucosyltransferase/alpha-amylase
MFNFWVNQHLWLSLATADARPLAQALRDTQKLPPTAQWANFLRNHDELDLGRLTKRQREQVFAAFGPEPDMQLYGRGIRRRAAPMLGDLRRLQLAYSLVLSLPGTPVLRYGDEIGMGDDLRLPERAAIRTPMQWSAEWNGGFSAARRLVRPAIARGVYGYERVNVDEQRHDPHSLLRWTQRMIGLRKQCPEIGWGTWQLLPTGSPAVLALQYDWRGTTIVCVHNLAAKPREARLETGLETLTGLLDVEELHSVDGVHAITLEAFGYRWYRGGERSQALARDAFD